MKKILFILPISLLLLTGCNQNNPSSSSSTTTTQPTTSSQPETELRIVSQPVSKEIKFGEPVSFEVGVNNEALVKSYQWELLNVEDDTGYEYWVEIKAQFGNTNKLYIPGPCFTGERPYRCKITDTTDKVIYSEEASYSFKDYYEGLTYCEVGTRILIPGQTLDLADTIYGSGKVSINEAGDKLTLDNVKFSNGKFDYDPYDSGVAFYLMNYKYNLDTFTVEFKGDNVIYNSYYEPDIKQGGIGFGFFFSGRGTCPNVKFVGDGNLSVIGGSHCIYSNAPLEVGVDLTLRGIGDHYNSGIHAKDIVIKEDVRIFADLSVYLFEANGKEDETLGNITMKKGAYVDANFSVVQDGTHGSALAQYSVVTASNSILMNGATLNVDLLYDYRRLDEGTFLPPVEIMATHKDCSILIQNNSSVNFNIKTINADDSTAPISFITNGIVASGSLYISDSNVRIIGDTNHCQKLVGVIGDYVQVNNSTIIEDIVAKEITGFTSNGDLDATNSIVDIHLTSTEGECLGILAIGEISLAGSSVFASVNKGIALGTWFDSGDELREFDPEYHYQYLNVDTTKFIPSGSAVVNIYSRQRPKSGYEYFETLYSPSDKTKPLTEFIYIDR